MIRRSPAEAYIKYLLLHPKKYDNGAIKDILEFAQLDFINNGYLQRLRAALDPPKPFYPFDTNHRPSRNFVLLEGLAQLFTQDDAGRKAFKILERPRVKEFVEASLISNAPAIAIAHTVARVHRISCTPLIIERYRAFFWDVSLVDSTELRALLSLRIDSLQDHADADVKKQHGAMKRAAWSDSRRAAANLPFSPVSALLAQMRMGVMPTNIDVSKVLELTRNVAILRTFEAVHSDGVMDAKKALDLAGVVEKTTAVLKEVVKPDEEFRKELSEIALRTTEDTIPTVHMLSAGGGSFTTDVGPKETPHELTDDGTAGAGDSETAG